MTSHKNKKIITNKGVLTKNKDLEISQNVSVEVKSRLSTEENHSNILCSKDKVEQIEIKIEESRVEEQENSKNEYKYVSSVKEKASEKKKDKEQYNKGIQTFEQFRNKRMNSLNKDLRLKYYTKLLLSSMGYYCDLEVNILTQSFNEKYKKEHISDIDVLGCRIDNDLSITLVPVECKSGEDGSIEELLKLKGVMDYLGSHKGYLIKNKIATNAREIGEKVNISTLDNFEIRQLLKNLNLLDTTNDEWVEIQLENYIREKYICENSQKFTRIMDYIKNDYWHQKNFRNIHNMIFLVSSVKNVNDYKTKEGEYALLQISKYMSLSVIQLASYAIHKNYGNPVDKIKEYIFGGAKERREREVLFDKINQVLATEAREQENFEPEFVTDLIEICLRFMAAPNFAKQVPICIDNCMNAFVIESIGYNRDKLTNKYKDITLKLAKDVIIFICKQANIKPDIFEDILNL